MSKYHNQPTDRDGQRFASKAEANRYGELRLLERAGQIKRLRCQPRYALDVNGVRVGTYIADFDYEDECGKLVIEDVKSKPTITSIYRLKKKLVAALYGIDIREVKI